MPTPRPAVHRQRGSVVADRPGAPAVPDPLDRAAIAWAAALGLPAATLRRPGTSLVPDERRGPTDGLQLWLVGPHTIVELAPDRGAQVRALLARRPPGHRLSPEDLLLGLGGRAVAEDRTRLLLLDPDRLRPADVPAGHTVTVLTADEEHRVAAFLARCPLPDQREADVGVGGEHRCTVGVQADGRLVAVASAVVWRGFADLGVLTLPEARGRGAASAAVSRLCLTLAAGPRPVLYRHAEVNTASQRIADALGLVVIGAAETVRPVYGARPRARRGRRFTPR